MEQEPQPSEHKSEKASFNKEIYSKYVHLEEMGAEEENFLTDCKKNEDLRQMTLFFLSEKLHECEHPEITDKEYQFTIDKILETIRHLARQGPLEKELLEDFLAEQGIGELTLLKSYPLEKLRAFIDSSLRFFDTRFSSTVLALAEDTFPEKRALHIEIREKIQYTKDVMSNDFFETLPRDETKISLCKKRIDQITKLLE